MTTILLASVFLGGYYLGRQPDSPDIFGWFDQGREAVCPGEKAAEVQPAAVGLAREWDPAFRPAE
ncbi:MAG: hypothetical protein ACYTF6_06175 [Planctomycetota bacterium]